MPHDRVVYKLQRDGRTLRCESSVAASTLLGMGWTLSEPAHPRVRDNFAVAIAACMRELWRLRR
jgi:hypothetical protein